MSTASGEISAMLPGPVPDQPHPENKETSESLEISRQTGPQTLENETLPDGGQVNKNNVDASSITPDATGDTAGAVESANGEILVQQVSGTLPSEPKEESYTEVAEDMFVDPDTSGVDTSVDGQTISSAAQAISGEALPISVTSDGSTSHETTESRSRAPSLSVKIPEHISGSMSLSLPDQANSDLNDNLEFTTRINPNTPGKVVDAGQEHTGRWTREEHEAFLSALQMYGKEWKKVAAKVKTRTVVQTRTHAQKYFQKLHKAMGEEGKMPRTVEMGVATEAKKTPASQRKKQKSNRGNAQQREQAAQAVAAAQAAAELMVQMPTARIRSSTPTQSVGHPSIPDSTLFGDDPANPDIHYSSAHSFVTPSMQIEPTLPPPVESSYATVSSAMYAGDGAYVASVPGAPMKIVAPEPDQTMKRGKFPEPSPAACGKRKLAEIAAAQMLAGVAASGGGVRLPVKPPLSAMDTLSGQTTPPPVDVVPPPQALGAEQLADSFLAVATSDGPSSSSVSTATKPSTASKSRGLTLQIVNPEALGVTFDDNGGRGGSRRKCLQGLPSPSTPWDGQLEALVSEVKNKEAGQQQGHRNSSGIAVDGEEIETSAEWEHGRAGEDRRDIYPHPVCGPGTRFGRSALHKAVCDGSAEEVRRILSISSDAGNDLSNNIACRCDDAGFFPLHSAASLRMNATMVETDTSEITRLLLAAGADAACRDMKGNTPLHWAARAGDGEVAHFLILKNCPLDAQNNDGETALHWAMRVGVKGLNSVRVLVEDGARASVFSRAFKRPLDVAAEGFVDEDCALTVKSVPEKKKAGDKGKRSPKPETAEQRLRRFDMITEKRKTRANLLRHSVQSRTLILHHPECLEHIPKSNRDWEVPDRVRSIMGRIQAVSDGEDGGQISVGGYTAIYPYEVTITSEFERAKLELLSRIHSAEYLAFVNDLSKELERRRKRALLEENEGTADGSLEKGGNTAAVVPFTPMVQRTMMKESSVKKGSHSDTSFSAGSLRAARRAAGAVQYAVDRVLVGRNRNAFCVVRPPGHHAGVKGLLAGGESCGFCIFNNVAAGAMHALSDERSRPRCERCAIVDIDVHHGNGTEEIVRKCHDPGRLLFFSVHLYDHDRRKGKGPGTSSNGGSNGSGAAGYKFYPGTGDEDDVAHNIINVPIAPLWREKDICKNSSGSTNSTCAFPVVQSQINTRQKTRQKAAAEAAAASRSGSPGNSGGDESSDLGGKTLVSGSKEAKASDTESETGSVASRSSRPTGVPTSKSPTPLPSPSAGQPAHYLLGTGRFAYRRAIQHRLLPALRAFNPDLILISAGFDASKGDVGNARHYAGGKELMGIDLEPEDYAWTTRKIMEVADICCQGRVVSVLEGGYGRTPTSDSQMSAAGSSEKSADTEHHLDKTFFAECALRHLHALIDPYDSEMRDIL